MSVTHAVILAAGKGERLDRQDRPKPLVHVGHKPLILWVIEQLQEAGVQDITIVVGDGGEVIQKELLAHPAVTSSLMFIYQTSWERGMLESLCAVHPKDETFFVTPCDVLFEKNPFVALTSQSVAGDGTEIVSVLGKGEDARSAGANSQVRLASDGTVASIGRDIPDSDIFETGAYLFSRAAFEKVCTIDADRFDVALLKYLAGGNKIRPVYVEGKWFDVNTPETCIRAELFVRKWHFKKPEHLATVKVLEPVTASYSFTHKREPKTDVIVARGIIDRLSEVQIIPELNARSTHFILTDTTVAALFGEKVLKGFRAAGYDIDLIAMDPGEHAKTLKNYELLAEDILGRGIDERSVIISLGGGAVGNVAGFLAATLYRGIGLIHIPTTLMGQADAAIGIKQGVNGEKGKNLVGTYYEPLSIVVDPNLLATLPERAIRDGLGECVKHALVQSEEYFRFFRDYHGVITDPAFLEQVLHWNIKLKIELMERDFFEEREAMVLQYGHEVGHAIEYLSGFTLYHGESVAIGMRAAAELALILGICNKSVLEDHLALLRQFGFQTEIPETISTEAVMNLLRFTKKARHGDLRFALPKKTGALWTAEGEYAIPCPTDAVRRAIDKSKQI